MCTSALQLEGFPFSKKRAKREQMLRGRRGDAVKITVVELEAVINQGVLGVCGAVVDPSVDMPSPLLVIKIVPAILISEIWSFEDRLGAKLKGQTQVFLYNQGLLIVFLRLPNFSFRKWNKTEHFRQQSSYKPLLKSDLFHKTDI